MKNKKALGLFLSLVLVLTIAVPRTLATQFDTDATDTPVVVETEPVPVVTEAPTEALAETEAPTEASAETEAPTEAPAETEAPTEALAETEAPTEAPSGECTCIVNEDGTVTYTEGCPVHTVEEETEPVCTCTVNEDGTLTYTEGCPVHTVEEETEPVCTCIVNEDGSLTLTEGCPVHDPEEEFVHIEGCSEDCIDEECPCLCHVFKRLMECEDFEEFLILLESIPEEDFEKFTEKQLEQINQKLLELGAQPLPPIEIEESIDEPVISEIVYPTVNYAWAAPFGAPVVG